jgi:hypothetical protein
VDQAENTIPLLLFAGCCLAMATVQSPTSQLPPSNGSTCHIVTSLRLFVLNTLQVYRHFFFSERCACDVCDRPRLPSSWLGSQGDYSSTSPAAPSLRPLVPSSSVTKSKPVQVYHHHLFHGLFFGRRFFRFRGGQPLHNVQSLTFCNLLEIPTARFTTSNYDLVECPLAS